MRRKQFWDDDDDAPRELSWEKFVTSPHFQPILDARKRNNAFFSFSSSYSKQISPCNPLFILFLVLVQTVRTVFDSVFSPHERILNSRD